MIDTLTQSTKLKIQMAARDKLRATGLTHPLYRYPASMSPALARELILTFTEPGNTILDPFCGGGTTAIESLSNGRRVICSDINPLASFVTLAKAWPLPDSALAKLHEWFLQSRERLRQQKDDSIVPLLTRTGKEYSPKTHGLLLSLKDMANGIAQAPVRRVALLITLQVGKLCFDCRKHPPSPAILLRKFEKVYHKAITTIKQYSSECYKWDVRYDMSESFRIYKCSIHDLPKRFADYKGKVNLVLTSPPYPGTHVHYNRWQIHGRGETDLPYSLLDLRDGHSTSFYTLGDRKEAKNRTYFTEMELALKNLRVMLRRSTLLAQVVSFPDARRQLSEYKELMERAGYREVFLDQTGRSVIPRNIPNRRWYTVYSESARRAKEYIMIHRLK